MLSRALILATVILLILVVAPDANAQNLEAGKSPSQIFAGSCAVCHHSARGLLKTVQPGALPGFLREHYTTGRDMATQLSAYLLSNGATDPRGAGSRLTKQGQDTISGSANEPAPAERQGRRPRPGQPQDAAQPDADGLAPDPRTSRARRNRADPQQQQAAPAPVPEGQVAEPAPSRRTQKMGKKDRRGKAKEMPVPVEAAKPDAPKPDTQKPDIAPSAPAAVDQRKPVEQPKADPTPSAASTPEPGTPAQPGPANAPASEPPLRSDPVPQVTPAPRPAEPEPRSVPAPSVPVEAPAATPAPAPSEAPPRPTISVTPPPAPSPPPSGPPLPPISQ